MPFLKVIPENPNDPLYAETVRAIQDVASHCQGNRQIFLMETGQESPITMSRPGRCRNGSIRVNLDTANLILAKVFVEQLICSTYSQA